VNGGGGRKKRSFGKKGTEIGEEEVEGNEGTYF